MVHFPPFASSELCIHSAMTGYCPAGLPHSEIPGSKPVCGSPRLIAAYRVLPRLSAPRHPPCTLSSLTKLEHSFPGESYRSYPIQLSKSSIEDHWDPCFSRNASRRPSRRNHASHEPADRLLKEPGGADRVRTDDLRLARAALSQLSYSPFRGPLTRAPGGLVGLGRFELPTSRLSGVRSNQLSYRPRMGTTPIPWKLDRG